MVNIVSIDDLTEDDIANISKRRMREALGGRKVDVHGSTVPNHHETSIDDECNVCDSGRKLERTLSVCLRCSRAAKAIDMAIARVNAEEMDLKARAAVRKLDMIKVKAMLQRINRRGAKLNAVNKKTRKAIIEDVKREFEPK